MDYLHLYGSNITTWGVKSIYCRISELDISTVIQWQTDDLMHTRLSIHTSPILSLSFSRHIYVHSTIYSHLLLIINNCVKLQMILHLPLFLGNNMSMWNFLKYNPIPVDIEDIDRMTILSIHGILLKIQILIYINSTVVFIT